LIFVCFMSLADDSFAAEPCYQSVLRDMLFIYLMPSCLRCWRTRRLLFGMRITMQIMLDASPSSFLYRCNIHRGVRTFFRVPWRYTDSALTDLLMSMMPFHPSRVTRSPSSLSSIDAPLRARRTAAQFAPSSRLHAIFFHAPQAMPVLVRFFADAFASASAAARRWFCAVCLSRRRCQAFLFFFFSCPH